MRIQLLLTGTILFLVGCSGAKFHDGKDAKERELPSPENYSAPYQPSTNTEYSPEQAIEKVEKEPENSQIDHQISVEQLVKKNEVTDRYQLFFGCDEGKELQHKTKAPSLRLDISGEICVKSELVKPYHLIFMIDSSDSMRLNDPQCNRAKAARVIMDRSYMASKGVELDMKYTIIRFGTQTRIVTKEASYLNAINALEAVCEKMGDTHYVNVFSYLDDFISGSTDDLKKHIYFISDGQPEDKEAALVAAKNLRELQEVFMKFIYLYKSKINPEVVRDYLAELIGTPLDQITMVSDSDELEKIARLVEIPEVSRLLSANSKVVLRSNNSTRELPFLSINQAETTKRFRFVLEPTMLEISEDTQYTLEIKSTLGENSYENKLFFDVSK